MALSGSAGGAVAQSGGWPLRDRVARYLRQGLFSRQARRLVNERENGRDTFRTRGRGSAIPLGTPSPLRASGC